jgi:phytoene dehydrogenase-like protein
MILATGIVEELDLAAYGLQYLDVDPLAIAIGWGDEPTFVQWRSIERTLDGLARTSPDVAASYRRYLDVALPVARLLLAVQGSRATIGPAVWGVAPDAPGTGLAAAGFTMRPSAGSHVLSLEVLWTPYALAEGLGRLGRQPELSRYRTAVNCLFTTGAATFPGAGVWGASGRNAAETVLAA